MEHREKVMDKGVAIIGSSYRFPSSPDKTFWSNLVDNKNLVTHVEAGRWSFDAYLHPDKKHPGSSYTFAAGSIGDVSGFDASFFGISPREATLIDPQQRILLELAWEAIENAGKSPSSVRGSDCGVFIGISGSDYAYRFADDLTISDTSISTGNTSSIAANRISYLFDLHGPSLAIDTACSSSMVAFHQACQAIRAGEIEEALTGGIALHLHPYGFIAFAKATMLSPSGRCHVFDAAADGYVRSEGGGLFYLKDYQAAIRDGDNVLAIVAGSAVNTDGYKSGLTLPSAASQARLMEKTYRQAGIHPDEIDYLEAHGTGTPVGDPIETRAISLAIGEKRKTPLPIGSVKSNLGHMETASGVAGLAKSLYALQHRLVPATISLKVPNPNIHFDEWNIEVVTQNMALPETGALTIGVNSFGFGGANAHVILQTPPPQAQLSDDVLLKTTPTLPLVVSAQNEDALTTTVQHLIEHLEKDATALYDLAHHCFYRRERHKLSHTVWANSKQSALEKLRDIALKGTPHLQVEHTASNIIYVYSGNGCQWDTMGATLLSQSDVFKTAIKKIDCIFEPLAGFSLYDELKGNNGLERYTHTEIAQPALFAVQVGLTEILRAHHLEPAGVTGHSVGEVASAWASGALSLEDAVKVIYYRSMYQGQTAGLGQMSAVGLNVDDISKVIADLKLQTIEISSINSYRGVTLAGDPEQLTLLEEKLEADSIFYRRLPLNYAFHSANMDSIEIPLIDSLSSITPRNGNVTFYSTVTGDEISGADLGPLYWWKNIRQAVKFKPVIDKLISQNTTTFIEIGAHPVLKSYLNDQLRDNKTQGLVLNTLSRNTDTLESVQRAISSVLVVATQRSDMAAAFFPTPGQMQTLPAYPWQRERFWHSVTSETSDMLNRVKQHDLLGYPVRQIKNTWESVLDTLAQPWLADHAVGDNVVLPGAGFAEIMFAAIQAQNSKTAISSSIIELEEFEIKTPLLLDDKSCKKVRTSLSDDTGQIAIASREYVTGEAWVANATARYLKSPTSLHLSAKPPALPSREADFNLLSHLALNKAAGLNYGENFQTISHGWVNSTQVIAQYNIQPHTDFILHPAQLDCAFQLIIHFLKDQILTNQGIAYVPTRIGRIYVRNGPFKLKTATATLLKRSPHSITAVFDLFDDSGEHIAHLHEARFRAVRVNTKAPQKIDSLDYHLTSVTNLQAVKVNLSADDLTAAISNQAFENSELYNQEIDPLFDALISAFIYEALTKLAAADKLTKSHLEQLHLLNPDAAVLMEHVILYAQERELLTDSEHDWQLVPQTDEEQVAASVIWQLIINDYPSYFMITQTLGRFGLNLFNLLDTHRSVADIGIETNVYGDLVKSRQNSLLIRDICEQLTIQIEQLKEIYPEKRIRILELATGAPEVTRQLCSSVDFTTCDYSFATQLIDGFSKAELLKEDYPLLKTHLLDDDGDEKTLSDEHQIIIININGLLNQDLATFLNKASRLITSKAYVLLMAPKPADWMSLLINADHQALDSDPLKSEEQWKQELIACQYSDVNSSSQNTTNLSLITAQAPTKSTIQASPTTEKWLLIADQTTDSRDLSEQISAALNDRAQVIAYTTLDITQFKKESLDSTLAEHAAQHLIFTAGLLQDTGGALITARCKALNAIFNALEKRQTPTTLWVITNGVANTYLCDNPAANFSIDGVFDDAALWGFTRTLMNEATQTKCRLIDVATFDTPSAGVTSLICEFATPSLEHELFIDQQGDCYAPRLRKQTLQTLQTKNKKALPETDFYLGFKLPGQLRHLKWFSKNRPALANDDIRVAVKATGLNFRDIMYTLGLLSDEAIENGFAGPTLGFEFAGEITELGAAVSGYALGDWVVGFGPASFSNSVVTKDSAIALIPKGISFEAAATIPSTFFTVYYAMHHLARIEPGEKVLIHGAAGGVGIAAIQIARWLGAEIYATVGSQSKRDFLQLMGVENIYDSRSLTFAEEILVATGEQGVDVVLNSLAGEAINQNFRVLKPFGRFLELGKRDFYENTHIGLRPFRNNISYFGIDADQLMKERPDLTRRLFKEMIALFADGTLHPLPHTRFDGNQIVDAFRFMQQAKQIGKIIISYEQQIQHQPLAPLTETTSLSLDKEASYLVTGGLAGFGLKTAQWLVSLGAKNLILISRSGANSADAQQALAEFEQQGVNVLASACDVTNRSALSQLLARAQQEMPPLKGLIHAAAVIEDSLAINLSDDQIDRVFAPKICGAQLLDELTNDLPLAFFVLYSSATSLLGNPGQSCYVAANHWLEALCANRRARGKVATCPRWGAIDDVGFLARNQKIKDALQSRIGGQAITSDKALRTLELMILNGTGNMAVLEFEWSSLKRFLPSSKQQKFTEIALFNKESDATDNARLEIADLLNLDTAELKEVIIDLLRTKLAQILMISEDKLENSRSMYDMGLDSLMGAELMSAIESSLGVSVSVMALSETPTLEKLASRLVSQLRGESSLTDDLATQVAKQHLGEKDSLS